MKSIFRTKKYDKSATIKQNENVIADIYEKVETKEIFIAQDCIETVVPMTMTGFLDEEMQKPVEYQYFAVTTKTGDKFDLDSVSAIDHRKITYQWRSNHKR